MCMYLLYYIIPHLHVLLIINIVIMYIYIIMTFYFFFSFWFGVELDSPKGTCDGSKGGKQYFKCKANHGVFVLPSKVSKIRSKDSIDYTVSGGGNVNVSSPSPNPPGERKKRISTM